MSCCIHPLRQFRRARTLAQIQATPSLVEVTGTWDFKWPLGSRLEVAFQRPAQAISDDELRQVLSSIKHYALSWATPSANIELVFEKDNDFILLPAAIPNDPQQLSNLRPADARPDYDVLVSLDPLPLVRKDRVLARSGDGSQFSERIFLPRSELGSYARRVDYGSPTLYLGPPGEFGERCRSGSASLLSYFQEPFAKHSVVHEFGHVLGLAHENQRPDLAAEAVPAAESEDLQKLLSSRLGITDLSLADIEMLEYQLMTWPGNPEFSDWRPRDRGTEHEVALGSVMTVLHYGCAESFDAYDARVKMTAPDASDLAQLARMYPRFA